MTKKIAYLGIPHVGGTFTVFLILRKALEPRGYDVRWVGAGRQSHEAASRKAFDEFRAFGEVVGRDCTELHAQLIALKAHLEGGQYSAVFVNTACGLVETNIARYLDPSLQRVQIVHTITPNTYEYARIIEPWTHGTICVSPRAAKDLTASYRFSREKVFTIPTAVDTAALLPSTDGEEADARGRQDQGALKILFLGRIENASKGVFLLPKIAKEISDLPFELTIAGDGPDLAALKSRLASFSSQVKFAGRVPHAETGWYFLSHDVFLFPSFYEGMPMSLLEAMACGCVPVASRISGVTEIVVEDRMSGLLFPIGDARAAARALRSLSQDRALRKALANGARERARAAFSLDRMADEYVEALRRTLGSRSLLKEPIDPTKWDFPERFSSRLRQRLPSALKQTLRTYREVLKARAPAPMWTLQRSK